MEGSDNGVGVVDGEGADVGHGSGELMSGVCVWMKGELGGGDWEKRIENRRKGSDHLILVVQSLTWASVILRDSWSTRDLMAFQLKGAC